MLQYSLFSWIILSLIDLEQISPCVGYSITGVIRLSHFHSDTCLYWQQIISIKSKYSSLAENG